MNEKSINWMFGGVPDYSLTNYFFMKERTKKHAEGSLELIVENLVKTWEMERSHKPDAFDHHTIDYSNFSMFILNKEHVDVKMILRKIKKKMFSTTENEKELI